MTTTLPDLRSLVGAEFCVTCQQDCLPIPPHGTCGFCDRVPATGELVDLVADHFGSESRYTNQGCRCEACKLAASAARRRRKAVTA